MIRLGAQMSPARGYERIIREAGAAGLRSLQLFSRSPVGGQSRELPKAGSLAPVLRESGIEVLYIHAPYFVNPAASEEDKLVRARAALSEEMRRAKRLSAHYVVLHPGHWHSAEDRARGLNAFSGTVVAMLQAPGRILVENTAGQGRELGHDFHELSQVFQRVGGTARLGLMLDTAHAMAAGFPLATRDDAMRLFEEIDGCIGLSRLRGIHLNDSLYPVGSRRDRHAHLLEGCLGTAALAAVVQWAQRSQCPLILETPGRDVAERQVDMATVERLL